MHYVLSMMQFPEKIPLSRALVFLLVEMFVWWFGGGINIKHIVNEFRSSSTKFLALPTLTLQCCNAVMALLNIYETHC